MINYKTLTSAVYAADSFDRLISLADLRHVLDIALRKLGLASLCEDVSVDVGNGYRLLVKCLAENSPDPFDFLKHLRHQIAWSKNTFGPGDRTEGVVDHIRKELDEVLATPSDVTEWIDVVILALDGAWRSGHTPEEIVAALIAKQAKNEARSWPDWRTAAPCKAIEHVRTEVLP